MERPSVPTAAPGPGWHLHVLEGSAQPLHTSTLLSPPPPSWGRAMWEEQPTALHIPRLALPQPLLIQNQAWPGPGALRVSFSVWELQGGQAEWPGTVPLTVGLPALVGPVSLENASWLWTAPTTPLTSKLLLGFRAQTPPPGAHSRACQAPSKPGSFSRGDRAGLGKAAGDHKCLQATLPSTAAGTVIE